MGKKQKKLQIKLIKLNEREIEFDLHNFELPIANAIRRILLSEIPTMAIDKVNLYRNTSEMADFALCQRLGLIPIKVNATHFEQMDQNECTQISEKNTICLTLDVQCPSDYGKNLHVYSNSLKWKPIGDQQKILDKIEPVDSDILIMKLAPSQQIIAELECRKSIGKDHAKFCPVAACFYRFLTEFSFDETKQLDQNELDALHSYFPPGFLDFDQINADNGYPLIIENRFNRSDFTMQSWPQSLRDKIIFQTKTNVLVFTVESIGMMEPFDLVLQSIDVLKSKCTKFIQIIKTNL